jgi:tape measure domain-containing protein
MATDLERLVVRLEAQMRTFEREMARGRQVADGQLGAIERRFRLANTRISNSFTGVGTGLNRILGALGVGLGARELQQFADKFTQIQNSLKIAGLEGEALEAVYKKLFDSAQKNAAPLDTLASLYSRIAIAQKELRVTSEEMLVFTDKVALALRTSGASAETARGALIQLSQAIGSGTVRAEEFNSILEGALPIAQAAAAGIKEAGGSVAKLRLLIIDGKVSSEAFFRGFLAGSKLLEDRAATMELTVSQAFTKVQNSIIDMVGKMDKASGASNGVVASLDLIARAVRGVGVAAGWAAEPIEKLKKLIEEIPDLKKYLLAPLLPVIQALEVLAAAGEKVDQKTKDSWLSEDRLEAVNAELTRLKEKLADAENPDLIGKAVELDRQRLGIIRERIAALQQEQAVLNKAVNMHGPPVPNGFTPSTGTGGRKPISLADYPAQGKKTDKLDTFERALFQAQKRIELLNVETRLIDENSAAIDRARLVVELETAAKAKNQAEGKKNIEVTKEQRVQIEAMADQMLRAAEAAERAKTPLNEFSRNALRTNDRLQDIALDGVKGFEDALVNLGDTSTTTAEKFKKMTASILSDIGRLLIRQNLTAPLATAINGLFPGAADPWAGLVPGRAGGGPVSAGQPYVVGESGRELFVPRQDGMIIPNHAVKSTGGSAPVVNYAPTYNFQGTSQELSAFRAEAARDRAQFSSKVIETVRMANKSNMKMN